MGADRSPGARLRDPIPARAGVGFKPEHAEAIFAGSAAAGWFEVHPENYMGNGGLPHRQLERLREAYPLSLHGVGLSIGGVGPIDAVHLQRVKALVDRYEPGLFSEHLAWSSHDGAYFGDLLPLPYTLETLGTVADHVDHIQEALGRSILIENPSTYVRFVASEMSEVEFLAALAGRTGCGLLLDVNNVFVSAMNHGFDAVAYIDAFPIQHVREMHLAGHAPVTDDDSGPLLIDAHDRPVRDAVWQLYAHALTRIGPVPTLIEWDNEVPAWLELEAEARRVDVLLAARLRHAA